MHELYIGSATSTVSKRSGIQLPPTFRRTARLRAGGGSVLLLIDRHPTEHCLVVSDRILINMYAEPAGSEGDAARPAADVAARRRFGFAVETELTAQGKMALPPLAHRLLGIGETVLLVSTGHQFQIWDLAFVRSQGAPDLVALANLHQAVSMPIGGSDEARLQSLRTPRPLGLAGQPEVRVQPMLPLSQRRHAFVAGGLQ